jgi:glycosyltransferase involved in cell wall biosynthesis
VFVRFIADAVSLPHGMASTQRVLALARGLKEAGAQVEVLLLRPTEAPDQPRNVAAEGSVEGIPYRYLPGSPVYARTRRGRRWQEALGLWRAVRALPASGPGSRVITYSRHLSTVATVSMACRRRGIPVAVELCEWPETQPATTRLGRWCKRQFCRHVARFADGFIPISRYIEERAAEQAARLKLEIPSLRVPILVDSQERYEEELLPFMHRSYVLFSGSVAYRKTIEFVLDAFGLVGGGYPSLQLVLTGMSEAEHRAVRQWVAVRGLTGRVELPGYIPRGALLTAYRRAEALLIPLFGDTQSQARFPSKLGEYLLSGRPVVTNAVGEASALLRDRESGFLAPSGAAGEFAAAVAAALADPKLAQRVGESGRQAATRHLDFRPHGRRVVGWLDALFIVPAGGVF